MTSKNFAASWQGRLLGLRQLIGVVALVPGLALATASINEQFTPATIDQGDVSTYKFTVFNDSTAAGLTSVDVTALLTVAGGLPNPQIVVAPSGVVSNSCGGTVTAAPGDTSVRLVGGNVPQATGAATPGTCVIEVAVTSSVVGNQIVTIPANTNPTPTVAGFSFLENGVPGNNTTAANATLLVTALQAPTGNKVFNPSPTFVGRATALTVTLSNPNSGKNMPLTSFTDTLPSGMVVANVPNAAVSCSGTGFSNGTVAATAGGNTVTLTGGAIGQSGTCQITVDVVVPGLTPASATTQSFTNTLAAGAIGNTRGLTSPAFSKAVTVNAPIAVTKSFSPATVPVGAASTMTIVIKNNGGVPLTGTAFTDIFPSSDFEATGAPSSSCSSGGVAGTVTVDTAPSPDTLTLSGATVAANGGTCTVTVPVKATVDSTYTNQIPANGVTNNEGIGSPAASATLTAYSQLRISKSVSPAKVAPGQWAEFQVTIQNYSSGAVNNAVFTDSLPVVGGVAMTVDPSGTGSSTCGFAFSTSGASPVVLNGTGGIIPASSGTDPGVCTITFRGMLPSNASVSTTFTNSLPVNTGVEGDGIGPGGKVNNTNTTSVNLPVIDAVDLSKSFSPSAIASGQTSVLTLTVFNRTVNALTATAFTDNLPAGLTLAANPAASTTCVGGSLQAFPGDTKVALTGATVPVRPNNQQEASCTVSVRVTGTAVGDYVNTVNPADFTSAAGTIPGPRTANLKITAGMSATKTFQPASVATGGVARATVVVFNQTAGQLTNVSINDQGLTGGLVVANPANAASSCGGSPVITANPGATGVRLDGAVLPAASSCTLSFDVQANGSGPWANTIPVGEITSAEGAKSSAAATASLGKQTASLALNKVFNPVIVTGNQPSLLTIDVVNTSNVAINNASFTDVFPQGIIIYSTPDMQTSCSGGTVAATPGGNQVSLTGATLAANATCQVSVKVTSVAFLNLTNTIPAGAVKSQGGYTNAQPTSATLTTLQGLGVSKGFAPAYVSPNQVSRLQIRLASTFNPNIVNPTVLTGLTYTDALPAGLDFAPTPNATSTCSGAQINVNTVTQALTLSGVTLLPGATCDLEVNVTAASVGQYLNTIPKNSVTTNEGVTNPEPANATLVVADGPSVTKSFGASSVSVGQTTELIVNIQNNANTQLTGVALGDNLPPGLAVANPANTSTTCTGGVVTAQPGQNKVSISGASLPANASCVFRATLVASVAGTLKNTIAKDAITSQQGLTNGNPAEADLQVFTPPGVTKTFAPAQIASSGTSTLTISLENANATSITLTSALVDALPGNVFVAGAPNIGGTCPGATAATAGGINITYPNGAVIPAGGCTIKVDVTSSTPGGYLNTIAAGQLQTNAGNNPEPANATLGVDQPAAPSIAKSFTPTSIEKGGISRLRITLVNPNAAALTLSAALTDTLPTNVFVAAVPNIGGTCTPGAITATAGAGVVSYANAATIPSGGCSVEVDVTSNVAGSYTNTIAAGELKTNAGSNPTPTQAGLVVRASDEPTVLKVFSPTTINPGGTSKLTITLGNSNAAAAVLTADLVDTLPGNVLVATPPAMGGSCTAGSIAAVAGAATVTYKSGASIPSGGCTIEVNVTSSVSGGPYVNTIAAGDLKTTLGTNGAPATAELLVNPGQPPGVSKSFAPTSFVAGQTSTLTISLTNPGSSPVTLTANLVDTLPAGLTIANPVGIAGNCPASLTAAAGGSTATYPSGSAIPAGGCSVQVKVTSNAAAVYTNTIPVNALQTTGGNNASPATADVTVTSNAPGAVASIAGKVYHDRNDNGVIDPGEEAIAGVTIELTQGGGVVATTTTNANGEYVFSNLAPGTYGVKETQPVGWIDGKDTAGSKGGSVSNDIITNVTLIGGDAAVEYNFGERRPPGGVASIPTLSEWGIILLSMLLAMFALREAAIQRRRR